MTNTTKRRIFRRSSSVNRRKVKVLQRRLHFLQTRLKNYSGDPSRDQAEAAAIAWSLDVISEWMAEDPVIDVDWQGTAFTDNASVEDIQDLVGRVGFYRPATGRMPKPHKIVSARFASKIDERNIIRLGLLSVDDDATADRGLLIEPN